MAKTNFDDALAIVLSAEGGYVDHPVDPGGATNRGITLKTLAEWRGRPVTKAEVRVLSRAEAAAIYRARYWNAVRGDDLPAGLDLALFDLAVNSGPGRSVRLLQRALGRAEDGRFGPRLLAAVAEADTTPLITALCAARRDFLRALPTYPTFGRGWLRRIERVERAARRMVRPQDAAKATISTPRQEKTMDTTKSILTSRTLWANAIGLASLALSAFGFNTAGLDTAALTEHLFEAVAAGSFVVSSLFRVLATQRLA